MKAIIPGSFCPVTVGHIDIINRAAAIFDEVVVAVGENTDKKYIMSDDARLAYVRDAIKDIPNVKAEYYSGLTVCFAEKIGADVILKGIRNYADMQYEQEMDYYNRAISLEKFGKALDTVYLAASPEFTYISSTDVRKLIAARLSVSKYVHNEELLYKLIER